MLDGAIELLNIFRKNGFEAYIVGGFVRDFILGKESVDIDISTSATPKEIEKIFKGKTSKSTKEAYGSIIVSYKGFLYEITTFRMELDYKDNRHPSKIIYVKDLITDLQRRDFTMNTLCMNYKGEVLDPLNSISDVKKHVIKTVGDPNIKLKEDSLRILRAIRFSSVLDFELSSDLSDAITKNNYLLTTLSYHRRKEELNKIFSSPNVMKGIDLIKKYDLEKYLDISINDDLIKINDLIGMWVQVNPGERYQFTSNEMDYMRQIRSVLKDKKINNYELYIYGNYVCYIAANILKIDSKDIYDRYDNLPITKSSDVKINKKDIIDILSLKDKSLSKSIFKDIEMKILDGKIDNNREALIDYVIETYKNNML